MENPNNIFLEMYAEKRLKNYLEILGFVFGVKKEEYLSHFEGAKIYDKKLNIFGTPGGILKNKEGKSVFLVTPQNVNNDLMYSEEATHVLRNVFSSSRTTYIDEFFGGLGRYIVTNHNPGFSDAKIKQETEKIKNFQTELAKSIDLLESNAWDFDRLSSYISDLLKEYSEIIDKFNGNIDNHLESSFEGKKGDNTQILTKNISDKRTLEEKIRCVDQLRRVKIYEDDFEKHVKGYGLVSDLIDSNNIEKLLNEHPNLIRLPNDEVEKVVRKYTFKPIASEEKKSTKNRLESKLS